MKHLVLLGALLLPSVALGQDAEPAVELGAFHGGEGRLCLLLGREPDEAEASGSPRLPVEHHPGVRHLAKRLEGSA